MLPNLTWPISSAVNGPRPKEEYIFFRRILGSKLARTMLRVRTIVMLTIG